MNRDQVKTILGAAAAIDPTIPAPDTGVLSMWAAMLDDVPADAGHAAVRAYYRSDAYADHHRTITPGDIYAHWKRGEQEARKRESAREVTAARAAIEAAPRELPSLHGLVARFRAERTGDDPDIAEADADAGRMVRTVLCPWCKAQPGQPCTTSTGRELRREPAHPARFEALHKNR